MVVIFRENVKAVYHIGKEGDRYYLVESYFPAKRGKEGFYYSERSDNLTIEGLLERIGTRGDRVLDKILKKTFCFDGIVQEDVTRISSAFKRKKRIS